MTDQERKEVADMISNSIAAVMPVLQQQVTPAPTPAPTPVPTPTPVDPNAIAMTVINQLQPWMQQQALQQELMRLQQQSALGPFANMDLAQLMAMPEPIRSSMLQYITSNPNGSCTDPVTNQRLDNIEAGLNMLHWEQNRHRYHRHKTNKVMAGVAGAALVGGGVYALHKHHKHKSEKEEYKHLIDATSRLIESKIDSK
jgi:hypothetical protein